MKILWDKTKIIKELLKEEFVIEHRMQTFNDFEWVINQMVKEKLLSFTREGKVKVGEDPNTFDFVC